LPTWPGADENQQEIPVEPLDANLSDIKTELKAYHDSGEYSEDVAAMAEDAQRCMLERREGVEKPALVLDIDETALSNWEVITRDNFGRPIAGPCDLAFDGPCGWAAWDQLGRDPAIVPTLRVFERARALKVTVFFITLLHHRPPGGSARGDGEKSGGRRLWRLREALHGAERGAVLLGH
jgi:predicted secreted acid phosphatase